MGSLSDAGHPEVAFFSSFLDGGLVQIFSQILYLRVNTKSDVNFISSRHIERENFSLPVDVPRSKTPLLKFPINATDIFPAAFTKPAWNGGDEEVVAGKISWAKSSKQGGARLSFPPWVCLRSKRFRAVSEQRTRNEGQRSREKWHEWKSGEGWLSFHFSLGQNRKSRSSVFLCPETKRKRLLRRLIMSFTWKSRKKLGWSSL